MSKKCTLLWRETNFQHNRVGALLEVEVSFCVAGARDCHLAKSEPNVRVVWQFQVQPPLHYTTLRYTTVHYITLHYIQFHYTTLQYNYTYKYNYNCNTTVHYSTLPYTNYITSRFPTLHSTTLYFTTLHYTTLHKPQLQLQVQLHYKNTPHHNYNFTTLQLQLQLHCTPLHPAVVGEVTGAAIATLPKSHNSNHLSVHQCVHLTTRDSQQSSLSYRFLILKLPPWPCAVLPVLKFTVSEPRTACFKGFAHVWTYAYGECAQIQYCVQCVYLHSTVQLHTVSR